MIQELHKLIKSASVYYVILLLLLFVVVPIRSGFFSMYEVEFSLLIMGFMSMGIVFSFKQQYLKLYKVDILIAVFVLYNMMHFFCLSKNSIFFIELWQRIGVLVFLFLLRCLTGNSNYFKNLLLIIILLHFIVEISLGALQFFKVTEPINKNHELTGSFTAPSFFGAYLSIGITICTWFVLYNYDRLHKKWLLLIVSVLLMALFFMVASGSRTSWLGLIIAIVVLILSFPNRLNFIKKLSKAAKIALIINTLLILLFAVNYAYNLKKDSVNGRLFTAKITSQEIFKKPLLGHGLFSFSEGYNEAKVNYFNQGQRTWNEIKNADYLYGALNDYMEVTYEIGLIGMLLLLYMLRLILKGKKKDKYFILGISLFIIILVFSLFSTLLSNQSMLIVGTVIVFLCFDRSTKKIILNVNSKYIKISFCIVGVCLLGYSSSRIITAVILKKTYNKTLSKERLRLYTKILSSDGSFDFFYGQSVYKKQDKNEGLQLMEQAILKNNNPKKIRRLALYHVKEGNFKRAEELLKFNVQNEPYRYEARMDLVDLYGKTKQTKKLKPLLLEIIDFPIKIHSNEVNGYKKNARDILSQISLDH